MTAATKETTIFVHYRSMVVDALGCSVEEADRFRQRIAVAFDMGEPVWMIADELRLRLSAPKPTKTPREHAIRIVQL